MASLSFNTLLAKWKQAYLTFAGDPGFRDMLLRSAINFQDFKLTAAQMDTLNATPVEVLAAPPAGFVNLVQEILVRVVPGATPFELGAGTLGFLLTDGSGAAVVTAIPNAQVESASTTHYRSVGLNVVPLVATKVVAKASADVTAGDGAVYGRIFYRTVKISDLV